MGRASVLRTFILEIFWTKVGLKSFFEFPVFQQVLPIFVDCPFDLHRKCQIEIFKIITCCVLLYLLSTAILHLTGSCPDNASAQIFLVIFSLQIFFAMFVM